MRRILMGLASVLTTAGFAQEIAKAPPKTPQWVAQRVEAWQPTSQERRWEGIGWASDLKTALKLAKESRRPVFLFTLDGKMQLGRC